MPIQFPDPRFTGDTTGLIKDPRFQPIQQSVTPTVAIPNFIVSRNIQLFRSRCETISLFGGQ